MGIQFKEIGVTGPEFWPLRQSFSRFPKIEERPRLRKSPQEVFGVRNPNPGPAELGIRFSEAVEQPRLWFVSDNDAELVQVQSDRFIRNWRLRTADSIYPRYDEYLRGAFKDDLVSFFDWAQSAGGDPLEIDQCEMSYLNHIEAHHARAEDALSIWDPSSIDGGIEDVSIRFSRIWDDTARVRVSIVPAYRNSDGTELYKLDLVARGQPKSSDVEGVMGFMDGARSEIVHLFTAITTARMHKTWGRR